MNNNPNSNSGTPRRRKPGGSRGLIITLIVIASSLILLLAVGGLVYNHFYGLINFQPVDLSNTDYTSDPISTVSNDIEFTVTDVGSHYVLSLKYKDGKFASYTIKSDADGYWIDVTDAEGKLKRVEAEIEFDINGKPYILLPTGWPAGAVIETVGDITTDAPEITSDIGTTESPETTTAPDTTAAPVTTDEYTVEIGTTAEIPSGNGVTNILVVGTDALKNENGRSDAMILVSINKNTKQIILTSFMRDTYVYIPTASGTNNRLNAAHSFGGISLLINTLKVNFGITVHNYVSVKYADFVKVYDVLDGLDLVLTEEEIDYVNDGMLNDPNLQTIKAAYNCIITPPIDKSMAGKPVHLNGDALFIYARARKLAGGDAKRTERQRYVLTETFNKAKTMSIADLKRLMDNCLPLVTTDITSAEGLTYILNLPTYISYEIKTVRLPMDHYYYDTYESSGHKTSYLQIYPEKLDEMMGLWRELVYGK